MNAKKLPPVFGLYPLFFLDIIMVKCVRLSLLACLWALDRNNTKMVGHTLYHFEMAL